MGAAAKSHLLRVLDLVPEYFFASRTDKGEMARGIEYQDEIGKAIDEAAGKFLLLVKSALHLAALGDVHERALIAHYAAGIVAHGTGRSHAHAVIAVLAHQDELPALDHRLTVDLG